jgi:hypothetical protein
MNLYRIHRKEKVSGKNPYAIMNEAEEQIQSDANTSYYDG